MQVEVNKLKNALKVHAQAPNENTRNIVLNIVSTLCKDHDSIKVLKIRPQSQLICNLCKKYVNPDLMQSFFTLNCSCSATWHIECLKTKALETTDGFLDREEDLPKMACNTCKEKIPPRMYQMKIFGKDEFNRLVAEANAGYAEGVAEEEKKNKKVIPEENKIKEVICCNPNCQKKIIYENIKNEVITLDCDHKFCKPCVKVIIEEQMDAKEQPIVCPIVGCKTDINWHTIGNHSDPDKYLKYNIFVIGEENFLTCTNCGKHFENQGGTIVKPNFQCSDCKLGALNRPQN